MKPITETEIKNIEKRRYNMRQTIEVIYKDNVLKPLRPIKWLKEEEKIMVVLYSSGEKKGLRELAGTLSFAEARSMEKIIEDEFERVEDGW